MDPIQEFGQKLFDDIGLVRNEIRGRRMVASQAKISPQWPLSDGDLKKAIAIISIAADEAGLSKDDKEKVIQEIEANLGALGSPVTVAALEGELSSLQRNINQQVILQSIISNITDAGIKIKNATNQLQIAIDKLEDLNKIFSVITVGVSLLTSLLAAGGGNFGSLLKIILQLTDL